MTNFGLAILSVVLTIGPVFLIARLAGCQKYAKVQAETSARHARCKECADMAAW